MKIKYDFISNSSTTAYVICGYKLKNMSIDEEFEKKFVTEVLGQEYDENDRDRMSDKVFYNDNHLGIQAYDVYYDGSTFVIGKELLSISDECGIEEHEIDNDLSSLLNDEGLKKVKEVFNLNGSAKILSFIRRAW